MSLVGQWALKYGRVGIRTHQAYGTNRADVKGPGADAIRPTQIFFLLMIPRSHSLEDSVMNTLEKMGASLDQTPSAESSHNGYRLATLNSSETPATLKTD